MLKKDTKNRVDTRWVHKWKLIDGVKSIKSRLTMRGFKDRGGNSFETFAGTASRWGQRLVNSAVANNEDWVLFSFDVSQVFAKGMTFEELSRLTGQTLRVVEFDLDYEDAILIRTIPGYENFDPQQETLSMIKPIYGLKDAPRVWRKKLH